MPARDGEAGNADGETLRRRARRDARRRRRRDRERPGDAPSTTANMSLRSELASASPALLAMAIYAVAGVAASVVVGHADSVVLGSFVLLSGGLTVAFAPLMLAFWFVGMRLVASRRRGKRKSALGRLLRPVTPRQRTRLLAKLTLLVSLFAVSNVYSLLKRALSVQFDFHWDAYLADIDRRLHFGVDPWTALHALVSDRWMWRLLEINYAAGWTLFVATALVMVCASGRLAPVRNRFLLLYLFVVAGLGTILAGLFMSAGPLFYGATTGDHERFAGLVAAIEAEGPRLLSVMVTRDYLWSLFESGRFDIGTGISAFPSVHVALAAVAALAIGRLFPRLRPALWAYVGLILFSSVYLGWHYAIDGYVSLVLVLATDRLLRAMDRPGATVMTPLAEPEQVPA